MKIHSVQFNVKPPREGTREPFDSFKEVEAWVPSAPAVVLFGPNDVGKSNTLEALRTLFTGNQASAAEVRTPLVDYARRERGWAVDASVVVELEAVESPGSRDHHLLGELLQYSPPRVAFGDEGATVMLLSKKRDVGENVIDLVYDDANVSFGEDPQPLSVLRERLKGRLLRVAEGRCRDWERVVRHYETLVDACLRSRWLLVHASVDENLVWWLTPEGAVVSVQEQEAAREVLDNKDLWLENEIPYVGRFATSIASGGGATAFLYLNDLREFAPFDVVQVSHTLESLQSLETQLAEDLERVCEGLLEHVTVHCSSTGNVPEFTLEGFGPGEDPWLQKLEEGSVRLHPVFERLCLCLEAIATDRAPEFIRSEHLIHVMPVPPWGWRGVEGKRLVLAIGPLERDARSAPAVARAKRVS